MAVKLELLAPARDIETAKAAIAAGADAVFIGGPDFGARAAAGNSIADIAKLVHYAHRFGCRVHVTLNTLLYDDELDCVQDLIFSYNEAGVDALIVQDPAIFGMEIPQGLELHASTQCNVDSLEKLLFYRSLGFSQVVLPRETSVKEIKRWHQKCEDIRLEAFVAGSLCVGQSGICYISELLTGRSANRGECAQLCRLPMELISPEGRTIKDGHLLSLKDNLALQQLPELIKAGVTCFKIEGRLKNKDYVANLTAAFSDKLDEVIAKMPGYTRLAKGRFTRTFTPDPRRTFNRGFTSAYLSGSNDWLYNLRTPKSFGMKIGRVFSCRDEGRGSRIKVDTVPGVELSNGDGLTFFKDDGELSGFRASKTENVESDPKLLKPVSFISTENPVELKKGTDLYRNHDTKFIQSILAPKSMIRRMPLNVLLKFSKDRMVLSVTDALERSTVMMQPISDEIKGDEPLSKEVLVNKCSKCPDPDFVVEKVEILDQNLACVPISLVNELRRRVLNHYIANVQDCRANWRVRVVRSSEQVPYPEKTVDSRLVLNAKSRAFYESEGVKIVDYGRRNKRVLMTCRNCLIKNFAVCSKKGGKVRGYKLRIGDRLFGLETDCLHCRMKIVEER